jgi:prepilin-type N-terminal cleavage/methylation domain-containing protein
MNQEGLRAPRGERGFSLMELLVVAGIIVVLAAVALPSIGTYVRNYRINGAEREVTSEIAATRSRAISRNTQAGVSFMVVDANSYRFFVEDAPGTFGLLHDLPTGVVFQPPVGFAPNATSFRFSRLGAWCDPFAGIPTCNNAPATACQPQDGSRCDDGPGANYIHSDTGGSVVGLLEVNTGLRKAIRVSPGGRVQSVPQ